MNKLTGVAVIVIIVLFLWLTAEDMQWRAECRARSGVPHRGLCLDKAFLK